MYEISDDFTHENHRPSQQSDDVCERNDNVSEVDSISVTISHKMPSDHQLSEQIVELQDAVSEMKSAFTQAILELGTVEKEDNNVRTLLSQYRSESQEQIGEIVKLILSMKAEFSIIKSQVQLVHENQYSLQQQIHGLLYERDLLLDELVSGGIVNEQARKRFRRCRSVNPPASGSQSNDSGVAFLLEKAQAVFNQNASCAVPSPHSDCESNSLPENAIDRVSLIVQEYLASLGQGKQDEQIQEHPRLRLMTSNQDYDSDSSLTIAANKSLTLSTSLGKQCGLELDHHLQGNLKLPGQNSRIPDPKKQDVDDKKVVSSTLPQSPCDISKEYSVREKDRRNLAKELVDTEHLYCQTLFTLQVTFADPLKKSNILTTRDVNTLFPEEVYQLYEKHCVFLQKLESRLAAWKRYDIITDVLDSFTDPRESNVLGLYTSYVNDFPEVIKTFHKSCQQSPMFTKFIKKCLDDACCEQITDLGGFLLTPVQRIPSYIIFLKKMLKLTDDGHPAYENIKTCLNRLKEFIGRLNDAMEHSFQLMAAQINSDHHTSEYSCEEKFTDDDDSSMNNAETILIDESSDAESLLDKAGYDGSELISNSSDSRLLSNELNISVDILEGQSSANPSTSTNEDTPVIKSKQVPKKPPRRKSYQNEIYSYVFSPSKYPSNTDVGGNVTSCNGSLHCSIVPEASVNVTNVCAKCGCCKSCCERNESVNDGMSNAKREMGKSLGCISDVPESNSRQDSLIKSLSVNRVSEWKQKDSENSIVVENRVKKMGKMKAFRTSLKNIFRKRRCAMDIVLQAKDIQLGDSSELSSSFVTLNDDFDHWSSNA